MKHKTIILVILLLGSFNLFALDYQSLFSNQVHVKENYVLVEDAGLKKIIIPFHYNQNTTNFDPKLTLGINPNKIRDIEYIYYENTSKSYQEKLNNARIETLLSLFGPRLKNVAPSAFSTVVLTNKHVSRTQFTGFIVTTELTEKENRLLLQKMLSETETEKSQSTFTIDTLEDYGYILPHLHHNLKAAEYNVVAATLGRNKSWKNKLIVVDVTGSMIPYLSQYLLWLNLNHNPKEIQNYVFFNDGNDNKGYNKKLVGKTGGLYFSQNSNGYSSIEKTVFQAILNGSGGDRPENNIEALLAGEMKYKASNDIIMIADNYASPRDMELNKKLKKPVHVILCGVRNNEVNIDYLNLAYKTKGSVHTIENDLSDLIKKKEGDVFSFLGVKYQVKDGIIETFCNEKIDG